MLPLIGLVVGAVKSIAGSWLETRKVKAEGKIALAKAKVDFKVAKYTAKSSMDLSAMEGMRFSWKDEYLLVLLTMPVIGSFIPGMEVYIAAGFDVLKDHTPDWYKWALTGMIAATFGLRTWTGFKK